MRNANGYGSIVKLSGKRRKPYAVKVTTGYKIVNGKALQKQKYIGYFERQSEAAAFLADYNRGEARIEEKRNIPTLEQIYREWYNFKWHRQNRPAVRTFDTYDTDFKKLSAYHDYRMDQITLDMLQRVLDDHRSNTKSVQVHLISLIHNLWAYSVNHDYLTRDISQNLILEYSKEKVRRRSIFTDDEIRRLIGANAADPLLMIFTGMRCAEMCSLTKDKIFPDHLVTGVKTDAGRDRYIPLALPIRSYVRPVEGNYYYESNTGKLKSTAHYTTQIWHPLMDELGMEHTPHDCRHTCASLMERAEIPLLHRKLILGHKVTDITEGVYTHVPCEDLMKDMEKMMKFFF